MTATNGTNKPELRKRVEKIRSLPSSPAVLQPLLDLLRKPPEQIHIEQVVKLVSYEKTITAQLLRIANSPLYGRAVPAESIQAAVATLGIQRIEDILLSNCFNSMVPRESWVVDPGVFWRHSFGCALVCQEFAEQVDFPDSGKAYLAGLLHDLGIIVNSLAYTDEYRLVIARAAASGRPLEEQEQETMGFTHCDSGAILAHARSSLKPSRKLSSGITTSIARRAITRWSAWCTSVICSAACAGWVMGMKNGAWWDLLATWPGYN